MISKISFKGVNNNNFKQNNKIKNIYQQNALTTKKDCFTPSSEKPKTTLFKAIESKIVNFYNSIFKKTSPLEQTDEIPEIYQELERIKEIEKFIEKQQFEIDFIKINDDEKLNYFNEYLFTVNSVGKSEEERLTALDLLEKYGLDLIRFPKYSKKIILSDNFRSSDNIEFFKYVDKFCSEELRKRYIEVFKKYIEIKPEEVNEILINSMCHPIDIENIESAIEKIDDENKKNQMQKLFSDTMEKKMQNPHFRLYYKFLKSNENYLYPLKRATNEEKNAACKKFGTEYGDNLINKTYHPLTKEEMLTLALKANLTEKTYDYCMDNFKYLAILSNSGSIIQNTNLDFKTFKTVVECTKRFLNGDFNSEDIDAVIDYTNGGGYDTINGIQRLFGKIDEIIDNLDKDNTSYNIAAHIKELEKITHKIFALGNSFETANETKKILVNNIENIKTNLYENNCSNQELKEELIKFKALIQEKYQNSKIKKTTDVLNKLLDNKILKNNQMKFIRYEGMDIFNQLTLNDELLSDLMHDKDKKDEILNFLNEEKPTITQSAYTSTSVYPYEVPLRSDVKWILKGDENTKGYYIADIRNVFEHSLKKSIASRPEAEFLFAPGAKLKINNAEFIKKNDFKETYELEGIITHNI